LRSNRSSREGEQQTLGESLVVHDSPHQNPQKIGTSTYVKPSIDSTANATVTFDERMGSFRGGSFVRFFLHF
jgi:hypothetical protein